MNTTSVNRAKMEETVIRICPRVICTEHTRVTSACSLRMSERINARQIAPKGIMKNASIDQMDMIISRCTVIKFATFFAISGY